MIPVDVIKAERRARVEQARLALHGCARMILDDVRHVDRFISLLVTAACAPRLVRAIERERRDRVTRVEGERGAPDRGVWDQQADEVIKR